MIWCTINDGMNFFLYEEENRTKNYPKCTFPRVQACGAHTPTLNRCNDYENAVNLKRETERVNATLSMRTGRRKLSLKNALVDDFGMFPFI